MIRTDLIRNFFKAVAGLLIFYFFFALIACIAPFIGEKPVGAASKADLDRIDLDGDPDVFGPDRALLVETPEDACGLRIHMVRQAEKRLDIVCHIFKAGHTMDAFSARC